MGNMGTPGEKTEVSGTKDGTAHVPCWDIFLSCHTGLLAEQALCSLSHDIMFVTWLDIMTVV